MKAFLASLLAVVLLSAAGYFGLEALGMSSANVLSSPNVRLD